MSFFSAVLLTPVSKGDSMWLFSWCEAVDFDREWCECNGVKGESGVNLSNSETVNVLVALEGALRNRSPPPSPSRFRDNGLEAEWRLEFEDSGNLNAGGAPVGVPRPNFATCFFFGLSGTNSTSFRNIAKWVLFAFSVAGLVGDEGGIILEGLVGDRGYGCEGVDWLGCTELNARLGTRSSPTPDDEKGVLVGEGCEADRPCGGTEDPSSGKR